MSRSPTWVRTRDLRINSTGHSKFFGSKVEEPEVIFFLVPDRVRATELMPNFIT